MSKNIVVCCDGTGNDFDDPTTDSNVVKLYQTLLINDAQVAYYHPGVGTMGSPASARLVREPLDPPVGHGVRRRLARQCRRRLPVSHE
jgi:uncharacterized protein (DUF2235 family)